MRIKIPDGSTLYLFGSFLKSQVPNDLDILVVYDPEVCPPESVYQYHRSMVINLSAAYSLRVHATFLTPSEQCATDFISRTGAVFFSDEIIPWSSRPELESVQCS